jgi:hypothetical protein
MIAGLWRAFVVGTLIAGAVGAVRQRREAAATRRGELPRASAAADVPPRVSYGPVARWLSVWVPAPPRTPLGRCVTSAWAGPLTVVGLGLAALSGRSPAWDPDLRCFVVRGAGGPSRFALRSVGAHANTVGQIVIATQPAPSAVLLAHEAVHARQAERFGPLLFPLYVWLGARYGYRDNPLERAARAGARQWMDQRSADDAPS